MILGGVIIIFIIIKGIRRGRSKKGVTNESPPPPLPPLTSMNDLAPL